MIKCNCADRLDKSNAETLIKEVDKIISNIKTVPVSPEIREASIEFWQNSKKMLQTIQNLSDC